MGGHYRKNAIKGDAIGYKGWSPEEGAINCGGGGGGTVSALTPVPAESR